MKGFPVDDDSRRRAEAARYALLRRLAPALRHRMVGALHPVELIAAAMDRQLQEAVPDLALVRGSLGKIKNLSRSAAYCCTNLSSWLAPEEEAATMLGEGMDECLALLKTDFDMRGFAVRDDARDIGVDVPLAALRTVLTGSLIAVSDDAPGPADLVLTVVLSQDHVALSIQVLPAARIAGFPNSAQYRRLAWSDVEALARSEAVDLVHEGDRVTMRFPVARVPGCGLHPG